MRIAALIVLVLSIGPAFAVLQDQDFKISTDVFNVLLDVGVRDSKGGYVAHLTKDDFRVEEDGIPQKISSFSAGDVPVTAGLVMDDSGSMVPKRADLNEAGEVFVAASNPRDEIFVINFNDKVHFGLPPSLPFSDDAKVLAAALARDQPAGRTTLYDAIAAALDHLESGTRDRKTLVVVSDGGDNASKHNLQDILRMIEESHATIYTVALFDPEDPYQRPRILKRIASISGGRAFAPERSGDIIPISLEIAKDIRERYAIGYVPEHGPGKAGTHTIRVTASAPNRGKLTVQTRTSYVTPNRP